MQLAREHGIRFFETSAKSSMNVDEVRHTPSFTPKEDWKTDLCSPSTYPDQSRLSPLGFQFPGTGHLTHVRRPEIGELVVLGV